MNEREQAREALSDVLFSHCGECWKWDDCLDDIGARFKCPSMVEQVKCILSLSGPGWSFEEYFRLLEQAKASGGRLAVVREKGELPRVEQPTRNYTDVNFGYQLAQQDMLDAGWVQEVPEEVSNVQDSE